MSTLRIARRFRGPPESGNGGYVAGLVASALGGSDIVVTLREPPPLEQELELVRGQGEASLRDREVVIASAEPAPVDICIPEPPHLEAAKAAQAHFSGLHHHVFPSCFVCGTQRGEDDGLRIFAGRPDPASEREAATWRPDPSLGDELGLCRPEFLWAALDCPGFFAVEERCGRALLGRIAAHIARRPSVGERLIVTGWPMASEGRKHQAGTALHGADGDLAAAAVATWITLKGS